MNVSAKSCALQAAHKAIEEGFGHAWATILDSNVTTLIVGLALLIFGSGAIRGFAVVHCLGILTSIFSSVFVSRGVVNLWYGRQKKLTSLSIGQIWKPTDDAAKSGPDKNSGTLWNYSALKKTFLSCAMR
jgi:preprotein translocase subunit SecD